MAESMEVRISEPKPLRPDEFIVPPDWAVRLVSTNHGKRCKKYSQNWVLGFCSYPNAEDYYNLGHPWGLGSGVDYEAQSRRRAREREERERSTVELGNLTEEQYRFWNGAHTKFSTIATCRWCRHSAYGSDAMRMHQQKTQHTLILRAIYDHARHARVRMCFTCGKRTHETRWGLPLCNTNPCRNKWRVGTIADVSGAILLYARSAFKIGLLDAWLNGDRSEKYNVETNPKQFNWGSAA